MVAAITNDDRIVGAQIIEGAFTGSLFENFLVQTVERVLHDLDTMEELQAQEQNTTSTPQSATPPAETSTDLN
jgi:hypothetical protein